MEIAIGIILILASVFLIVAVLLQQGKSHLSGAIGGSSSDTFLGKSGATSMDKKLSRLTTIVAIVFVVLVLVMYLIQDTSNYSYVNPEDTTVSETTAAEGETTAADAGVDGTTAADTTAAQG